MKKTFVASLRRSFALFLIILLQIGYLYMPLLSSKLPSPWKEKVEKLSPKKVQASYQFRPTSGELVTGTEQTILSATAASTEGVNTGSWKGTLSDDNFHWVVAGTSSGVNVQLTTGGVQLNGANTLILQTEFDLDATALDTAVQICDWVSSSNVNNAADTQCTTGGWRTITNRNIGITTTTPTAYHWQIYDGYFSNGNTPVSTPLSNFVNGSNNIKVRFYSTTNSTSTIAIDYLRIFAVINPIYTAGGFTNLGTGTVTNDYRHTITIAQSASDNSYLQVAGTAGSVADFYLPFKNVKTYTGMNTILVRAEYSCGATGINHRPKIYNFNTSSWEDLTTSSIACSATDATNIFAKNNVTISNYISGGEIRIGWRGLSNSTTALRIDMMYIMLGTTNTSTGDCEVSFGTNSSGDCSNTRDIDSTTTSNTWSVATEDESNTFGHAYYAFDNDADATVEEAASSHVKFAVTEPTGAQVTSMFFAGRYMSGTAGTVQVGLADYASINNATGGFTQVAATSTTALTYTDPITVGGTSSGGAAGMYTNAQNYIDSVDNEVWMRLKTTVSGATTNNSVNQWDFAMVSMQWIEDADAPMNSYEFIPTGGELVTGTEQTILSATAASNEGVNTGSWKGTLGDDNYHWVVAGTSSGVNVQLSVGGVELNGANTLIIQNEFDLDATVLDTAVQVCDWVSSTGVDNAADTQCTTGGWRTINNRKVGITITGPTQYHWQIYDGYFSSGNTPVSTPLTNFVNSSNQIKVRFYSTTNTTTTIAIDFLRIAAVVNPVYTAAGLTNLGSGAVTNDYRNTITVTQGASDNQYLQVAGTAGSIADFYLPFKNVKTYTGMNTILVRAEYSCTTTGINHRPKIYNFNTSSWEDLTTSSIACATSDTTSVFAKNNVTISNYISGGEIRIGWRGLSNNALGLRLDQIYIMLGTTNTDSNACEISFGSNSANSCTNTRDIDSTTTSNTWSVATEDESNTFGHAYYALDNDGDATVEEAAASHVKFAITKPQYSSVTSIFYAANIMSGTAGTVQVGIADYSGANNVTGAGFTGIGASSTTALTYTDSITVGGAANGGAAGMFSNPEDHIDTVDNEIWMRLRTTASGATTNNSVNQWDFAMTSIQWIEPTAVTVGTTGTQSTNLNTSSTNNHVGGAFTFTRESGTSTITSITISEKGTVNANNNLSNAEIYYETAGSCTYNANETLFGTTSTFNSSDQAVITGSMSVGTSQVCGYVVLDVGSGATAGQTIEVEISNSLTDVTVANGFASPTTVVAISGTTTLQTTNQSPNTASSLAQKKTDDTVLSTGDWVSATSIKFTASVSDPDSSDTLYLCIEKDIIGTGFSNTEDQCGTGVAYSGSAVTATVTITGITDANEYHWQARVKDTAGAYSSWSSYGGNAESARDFGLDTTAPTGGTVYDGTSAGSDTSFNDGSLTSLSANWSGVNSNASGMSRYDYSIGTTAGATDVKTWTSNTTSTSVTASSLTLQTSQMYYFNIRTVDNAGNISSTVSSNGQLVAPSLSFTLSSSSITFNNLNTSNSFTNTQTTTLTTSTNAYNGYIIRAYKTDSLRSIQYPSTTIADFSAGSYAAPSQWTGSNYGFGYTSSDTSIQGAAKFPASGSCLGTGTAPCYAPFSSTAPGDIVADHTATVTGTGNISGEQFTLTYKVGTTNTQQAGSYSTSLVYTIVPQY